MTTFEKIRAEIEHWESDDTQDEYQIGAMDMKNYVLRVIDKYAEQEQTTRQSCENCKQDPKECGNDAHYGFCQNWEKAEQEQTDKSNLEKICEELAAENDDLRDQLAMRDRFKQEPCDDAISRQAVLDLIADYDLSMGQVVRGIHALPPVTPQEPRKGHWIEIAQYSDGKHKIECSECKSHIFDRGHANSFNVKNKYKFCPNCGARMESER